MGFRSIAAATLTGAGLLLAPLGAQAGCGLQTLEVPVMMRGLQPMVAAKINGKPVEMLLDSGSFFNSIDAKFAVQQGLKAVQAERLGTHIPTARQTLTQGAAGVNRVTEVVISPSFEFAGSTYKNVAFFTLDNFGEAAGILGQNFLRQLDNEYDLQNGVLRLVKPQDCEKVTLAYWAKPGTTYSVAPLETTGRYAGHTISVITINGVKLRAYFDTGAGTSFITAHAAARAGVKTDDPSVKPAGFSRGLDSDRIKTWVGRFASIKIGDEEIKNGLLAIGDSDTRDFDVLIGADFFLTHHVYVANSQKKLYFTYNGGTVFRAPAVEDASDDGGEK